MNMLSNSEVLFIEDDPGILYGLRTLFEYSNLPMPRFAKSAAEAKDILNNDGFSPRLILVDGRLPDCHGLELIQTLRSSFSLEKAAIYLFSADFYSARVLSGLNITGCIRKPFDADELLGLAARYVLKYA